MTAYVLYRSNLSLTSGAGQLIRIQAEALQAAGENVVVACRKGWLKFAWRSGLPVRRASPERLRRRAQKDHCLIDHGMELPDSRVIFVHNLMNEAVRFLERDDWRQQAGRELEFFRALSPDARVVANSELVARALTEHFRIASDRVDVLRPAIDVDRFRVVDRAAASARARRSLGLDPAATVVGFVTSGDFEKRGLAIFMDVAQRLSAARPDARFLVVGARRLPAAAVAHPLVRRRLLIHRPKGPAPERWLPALDVFLYPAHFEEFGMVVGEALAAGVPVLTSRRVGAAECLPAEYQRWLLDAPEARAFAEKALALLADPAAMKRLAAIGTEAAARFDRRAYATASVNLIRAAARIR